MSNLLIAPHGQRTRVDWRRAGTRAAPTFDAEMRTSGQSEHVPVHPPTSGAECNIVRCDANRWAQLETHLRRSHVEEAAVLYASVDRRADGLTFTGVELELFQPPDFAHQSELHIELSEDAQQRVIKRAWALGCALVELHSHVDGRYVATFSGSDLAGFEEFVPHVWWRLRGQPYAAMVMTPSGVDALVWRESPHYPETLQQVEIIPTSDPATTPSAVISPTVITPTHATLTRRRSGKPVVASPWTMASDEDSHDGVRAGGAS